MSSGTNSRLEHTLDPESWEDFRILGHRMIDDMVSHLAALNEKPAWQPMPQATRETLSLQPPPQVGCGAEQAYEQFLENILPYPNGNLHPRYWGWVQGTGTPLAMLADMLASGMNPHLAGFNQAPALVEHQVIDWLRQLMEMPETTSGLLVSGGMMANILGLAVARHVKSGFDVREDGLQLNSQLLTVYATPEIHSWLKKGCQFLGLGNRAIRLVPTNQAHQMDTKALQEMISADKKLGHKPIAVIGTAGTVNTGAIDDLMAISDVCQGNDLWFHVDGAFGAFAQISSSFKHLVNGLNRADSLGFDLHKWMYLPFEIACVLVRDQKAHHDAFAMSASYIAEADRGVIAGGITFAGRGLELTRNFKALKVWMSLKAHGVETFSKLIEQNIEQARHLESLIEHEANLELLAPVPLNVVCFRFHSDLPQARLNSLNEELLLRLQESGEAVVSGTVMDNKYALRAAIVNHRSKFDDFDRLVQAVLKLGTQLSKE